MFDVGSIRATLEVAGAQAFTQAMTLAGDAAEQLQKKLAAAGVPLKQVEAGAKSTGTALDKQAASSKKATTQAAALEKSLVEQVRESRAAAKAMDEATAAVDAEEAAAKRAAKSSEGLGTQLGSLSDKGKAAFTEVGTAALGFGAVLGAGVGVAISQFAEFDATMSQVQSASGATGKQFEKLRSQAIELGADTSFSANEAAEGQVELAKAGVHTADILNGGLQGALSLAAAGQISVAEAAETAATAMTQFNLTGNQVPHVADLLANGANKAQGGVHDLGMALNQSGLVASQFGVSLDDTVGGLAAFASQGLIGSDAGTSLKQMFLQLASPTDKAAGYLDQYNISAYDAQGNFVGLANLAGQLADGFKDASVEQRNQAFSTIFGSDAIRSANVLFAEGKDKINDWTSAVGESGGAAKTAAALQNNLKGDIEKLGGAFSSLFITAGEGADGPLRQLVQSFTGLIDVVNGLPAPVTQAGLGLTAGVAAAALLGGAFLTAVPKINDFRQALRTINAEVPKLGKIANVGASLSGVFAVGLTVATSLLGYYLQEQARAAAETDAFANSLDQATGNLTDQSRAVAAENLKTQKSFLWFKDDSVYDSAQKIGLGLSGITDAAMGSTSALGELEKAQRRMKEDSDNLGADDFAKKYGEGASEALSDMSAVVIGVKEQRDEVERAKEQWGQLNEAQNASGESSAVAAGAATNAAGALDEVSGSAQSASDQIDSVADSLKGLQDTNVSAIEAESAFQKAIDDASESVAKNTGALNDNKTGFDLSAESGRNANAALLDIASSAKDTASALLQQTGSQDQATGALDKGSEALRAALAQYGITGDAAQNYINTVLGTPEQWATRFSNNAGSAKQPVDQLKLSIDKMPRNVQSQIRVNIAGAQDVYATTAAVNGLASAIQHAAAVGAATPVVAHATGPMVASANGNFFAPAGVKSFAAGGVEYPHVAHFANAGTMRVFAEAETGGEAYIPLSPTKRSRSTEILGRTASMFGYELTPEGSATAGTVGGSGLVGMQLSGTLDLGGGLEGRIDAKITDVLGTAVDTARRGTRG
jgi:TP901 family phage tail tape measure protein